MLKYKGEGLSKLKHFFEFYSSQKPGPLKTLVPEVLYLD